MKNKIVLGRFEATAVTISLITTQLFLNYPRTMMESAWTAGWILSLYLGILALIVFAVIAKLYSNFDGKDILDIGEYIGGNIGRIITGLFILVLLLSIMPLILREFSENMKIISLPTTPISFVEFFFLAGILAGAYMGMEAIVRFAAIAVPIIAAGLLIIISGSSQYFDLSRITPVLGNGPIEIFGKSLTRISVYAGLISPILLYPFIKTKRNFKSVGYWSIIISTLFFTIGVLAFSLVYEYPTGTESFLPIYELARLVDYGRFFQRIESIFVLIWAMSALLHLSILMFLTVHIFAKTFSLAYRKPLIFPFAIIVFSLSLMPHNLVSAIDLETNYFRNYAWILSFLMPIVVLAIAQIKKKNTKKGARG